MKCSIMAFGGKKQDNLTTFVSIHHYIDSWTDKCSYLGAYRNSEMWTQSFILQYLLSVTKVKNNLTLIVLGSLYLDALNDRAKSYLTGPNFPQCFVSWFWIAEFLSLVIRSNMHCMFTCALLTLGFVILLLKCLDFGHVNLDINYMQTHQQKLNFT